MARVVFIDDTFKQPNRNGPAAAEVYSLWVENPAGLDVVIYDTRQPAGVLAHDHAERRGALLDDPFGGCVMFGPQGDVGGGFGGWEQGIPCYPPSAGVSFLGRPKRLGWLPVRLPGGIVNFNLECLFFLDGAGTRTLSLKAQLRPLAELGLDLGRGTGPVVALTHVVTGTVRETRGAFAFTDLSGFGDPGLDREGLCVEFWIVDNPSAATTFRLLCAAPIATATAVVGTPNEPLEWAPPRADIDAGSLAAGQLVLSQTAQAAHTRLNQAAIAALGGAPGLRGNLDTVDETDPWRRVVSRRHRHQGRRYEDPETGGVASDGAVIRRSLWVLSCVDDFGMQSAGAEMDGTTPKGIPIHPQGSLQDTQGWLLLEGRLDVPLGLTSVLVQFGLQPQHSTQFGRCLFYVAVKDLDGADLGTTLSNSAGIVDVDKSNDFVTAYVDPIDGACWQPNAQRQGLGLWTRKAKKNPLVNAFQVDEIPRVSKIIRVNFQPPRTGPVMMQCRFALETGASLGSGPYPVASALAFFHAWVPPGF